MEEWNSTEKHEKKIMVDKFYEKHQKHQEREPFSFVKNLHPTE